METTDIEEYKVKDGEEATPVIVLTGTADEFMDFCVTTNRNTKTAIAIRQGYQIPLYPELPIALYGNFWLNSAYDSLEYKDRIFKVKLQEMEENDSNNKS
jgi:hypothetical protein